MPRTTGRHELGQNFLVDPRVVDTIVSVVASWPDDRPLLELGPGDGALTGPLAGLGRHVTVVELDDRRAARLQRRLGGRVDIVRGDLLDADLGAGADVVSNVPYGITTPLLRRLVHAPSWQHALLLVQWEVARKRAGVGGTTMFTAQWWPWFTFGLIDRVPASSFRPRPSVDGGLLTLTRRAEPLLEDRHDYQQLVGAVFSGRGRGALDVVRRLYGRPVAERWSGRRGLSARALPRDLGVEDWVQLYRLTCGVASGPSSRSQAQERGRGGRRDDHRQERHP
ncbi:23S ribosomal RNA methyltransferase Erm [Aeromicrobium sp. CTD01-1L150]|uniref:23S ribosomal RNA methyltransferase Erm n=1 Tax=Aeromicrobium sp. CTD01-1L150 TaxID=3341830 RepID=UPI0035C17392